MSWVKLWEDWKIWGLLAMMKFHRKSISLHLSDCWPWSQYSFPVVCLLVSYREYSYARSILTATEPQIERSIRCYQLQANCNNLAISKVLEQILLSRLARHLWTADSQFGFKQAHGIEMAIFARKQTVDFTINITHLYKWAFLMQIKTFDKVTHWTRNS